MCWLLHAGDVQCPALRSIANSQLSTSTNANSNGRYSVGTTGLYTCDVGYILVDNSEVVCQSDGSWSGLEPACTVHLCGEMPNIQNTVPISNVDVSAGSSVTIACSQGYQLVGPSQLRCLETGFWEVPQSQCIEVSCPRLSSFPNGVTVVSDTSIGAVVRFGCSPGFVLRGEASATCQPSGRWSAEVPVCEQYLCNDPGLIPNGIQRIESLATRIVYQCNSGYKLEGSSVLQCIADVGWNSSLPVCVQVTCPHPGDIVDGSLAQDVQSSYPAATLLQYACDDGFELQGPSASLRCLPDGTWSHTVPTCRRPSCPTLTSPANGLQMGLGTAVGARVSYTCNRGYTLVGPATLVCSSTGDWNGTVPTCQG